MHNIQSEIESGVRFRFGENWSEFLKSLDDHRIHLAEVSLKNMLGVTDLANKTFLDIGCGSGLFSLVARRLGAKVHSFDYDPQSVACAQELKRRYFPEDAEWVIEEGSVLDQDYLMTLKQFDVVYSWGVLHHTGAMWDAIANASQRVASGGKFFIALYNDQGRASSNWLKVKQIYNKVPKALRWLVVAIAMTRLWGPRCLIDLMSGRPFYTWRHYAENSTRGMSAYRDVIDWVGGLPFEVAKPEAVFHFLYKREFSLHALKTTVGGHGCNEFVFIKN